jgi:hypothetical protein
MKIKKSDQKPKTISELCGDDAEAFERFLSKKNHALAEMDRKANQRVLQALEKRLAWAA